jgi:hypothetical protein
LRLGWRWLGSRPAARVALVAILAVAAAYQAAPPLAIDLGSGGLASWLARDIYPSEGGFRWTRAQSRVVVPDPGSGLRVRLEVRVAGWRPRGQAPPRLLLRAGGVSQTANPGQGAEWVAFETATDGLWENALELSLVSDTFVPGAGDSRALGVRLYEVRVVPLGPLLAPRWPPLRPVVATLVGLVLAFGLLRRCGISERRATAIAMGLSLAAAAAYTFARLHAAILVPVLAGALTAATLAAEWAPGALSAVGQWLAEAARALVGGARVLRHPLAGVVAVAGALAVSFAYGRAHSVEIPVGGGREALYATSFTHAGNDAGVPFRRAARGAALDLRDLGGGSPWRIRVTAASDRPLALSALRVNGADASGLLSPTWSTFELTTSSAPVGWRSGLWLEFPAAAHPAGLRVASVAIERATVRPSLRVVAAIVGAGLLAAVACATAGVSSLPALLAGAAVVAAQTAALAVDPVLAIPLSFRFLGIWALGAALAALLAALARRASRPGEAPALSPGALAFATLGFVSWLTATVSPLYRGGNFLFHSNVAEEIWHGAFMTYYLPYPGSMLSQQAQWGNVVVPHPFLYQLLVAPLAALGQPWFHHAEKAVLALFLSMLALAAALLAARNAGPRAGTLAAAAGVSLFPTFLLLGLGHLMTLFGCLALSLALTFLIARYERLAQRPTWWAAVALLTACWLSYTASLVFGAFVLAVALPFLWRRDTATARALVGAALAAGGLAFAMYYANWTWPFLRESLPRLLSGAGSDAGAAAAPLWPRVARIPGKLVDSYGSALVPLAGLAGLAFVARPTDRILLWAWGAVLVVFSVLDVFFNFLLKHHYATMTPIAVGLGLLLDRLWSHRPWGRLLALAWFGFSGLLALRVALDTALGRIP